MSPDSSNRHHCEDSIKSLIDENQRSQSRDKTATNLRAIVEFSSTAIGLPDVPQLADSDFFFYRGNAFFQLYRLNGDRASLESAVNDLLLAPRYDGRARAILDAIVQRSRILRKESALSEAVNLLEVAEGILRQHPSSRIRKDFQDQVQGNIADCRLRLAIVSKDIAAATIQCRAILSLRHYALRFALPLHYTAQMLLDAPLDENSRDLLREILLLIDKASRQPNLSVDAIRQLSSHVASLALSLGNEYLELALEQHLRSSAAGQGRFDNALKCSTIGRLSLGVGKRLLRTGHETAAFDHFRDAISWLRKALDLNEQSGGGEPLFDLAVTHGCLGETYLRLQGIDGGASLGRHALRHFEEARHIGDPPPESLSMMGDAHFRIGRYLRDPDHLKSAVKFKVDATNLGRPTREGWSVCAAAAFQLFAIEGGVEWLRQAISACVNAHQVDPKWPWPFLQLANFVRSNSADNEISEQIRSLLPALLPTHDVASSLGDALRARAVELVIENNEFERQVLGGRTQVFVLSDQHRLISSEIVLKPTPTTQARTEMGATLSLADFLKDLKLDDKFRVPTPVTIKDIGSGKAIYVMERAEGQTLAEALSGADEHDRNTTAIDYFGAALEFLAAYQAWRLRNTPAITLGGFGREIADSVAALGLAASRSREFVELASRCVPGSVPLLPKKDAHPENWLVTEQGLVMLDLESTGVRPLYYEVAQLIDDYGVLDLSDDGLRARVALTNQYLVALGKFGREIAIDRHNVESMYAYCWILRCTFGIGYCKRHRDVLNSTTRNRLIAREKHYVASLSFLSKRFEESAIGNLASRVTSLTLRSDLR